MLYFASGELYTEQQVQSEQDYQSCDGWYQIFDKKKPTQRVGKTTYSSVLTELQPH